MEKTDAIGIFDSGIGGLTVLCQCKKLLPNECFVYLSDEKNAPYGTKSDEKIKSLCVSCVKRLKEQNVKAVVAACNTATNVAIDTLREEFSDTIIVGVEPAVRLAVKECKDSSLSIVVLTTIATARQEKFLRLIMTAQNDYKGIIRVLPQEGLASLIESSLCNEGLLKYEIKRIFDNIKADIGAVVLGCTHYIYLKDLISDYFGGNVKIFDGNLGTANRLRALLSEKSLLNDSKKLGSTSFIVD